MTLLYNPAIDQMADVPDEAAAHFRGSGWLTYSEHQANQAEVAAREAAAAEEAAKTAGKGSSKAAAGSAASGDKE